MQSTSEYLEVSRGISEYLGDLDLADEYLPPLEMGLGMDCRVVFGVGGYMECR